MDKYLKANAIFSKFSTNYLELRKELPIRPSELGVLGESAFEELIEMLMDIVCQKML